MNNMKENKAIFCQIIANETIRWHRNTKPGTKKIRWFPKGEPADSHIFSVPKIVGLSFDAYFT